MTEPPIPTPPTPLKASSERKKPRSQKKPPPKGASRIFPQESRLSATLIGTVLGVCVALSMTWGYQYAADTLGFVIGAQIVLTAAICALLGVIYLSRFWISDKAESIIKTKLSDLLTPLGDAARKLEIKEWSAAVQSTQDFIRGLIVWQSQRAMRVWIVGVVIGLFAALAGAFGSYLLHEQNKLVERQNKFFQDQINISKYNTNQSQIAELIGVLYDEEACKKMNASGETVSTFCPRASPRARQDAVKSLQKICASADSDTCRGGDSARGVDVAPILDLRKVNLARADMANSAIPGAQLQGATLHGASFIHADLSGADLSGASLKNADLSKTNFQGATLAKVDLTGANLTGVLLQRATLSKMKPEYMLYSVWVSARLEDAVIESVSFEQLDLKWSNFKRASLDRVNFKNADLQSANFSGATLKSINFIGSKLSKAKFNDTKLIGSIIFNDQTKWPKGVNLPQSAINLGLPDLSNRSLKAQDLKHQVLSEKLFKKTNFEGANLNGVDFSSSDLSGANLNGVDLIRATLRNTNLSDATLIGADLSRANLTNANLDGADLTGIYYTKETLWPRGFTPPPSADPTHKR